MNLFDRSPLALFLACAAIIGGLLWLGGAWVRKPVPQIEPHQVQATLSNSVLRVDGLTGRVSGVELRGFKIESNWFVTNSFAYGSIRILTNGQLVRLLITNGIVGYDIIESCGRCQHAPSAGKVNAN